eukprot:Skav205765  [mRNA]  locus=scaffold1714:415774:418245:- [translate_table: standard]
MKSEIPAKALQVFQSIDKDKSPCVSGNLDFEEFRMALQQLNITEDVLSTGNGETVPESLIQEAFDVFDVDGDGQISLSELRVMLSGEGPLVEVLPNGQTVDKVMDEIAGGSGAGGGGRRGVAAAERKP